MAARKYIDNAPQATLAASVNTSATTVSVSSLTGFPSSTPYTATIDRGTSSAEVVLVTAVAGSAATVTRNWNGLGAFSHATGATFEHTVVAQDFTDEQNHIAATLGVHGAAGSVVGTTDTQTLTNKTLANAALTGTASVSGSLAGSGHIVLPRLFTTANCGAGGDTIYHNETATSSQFYSSQSLLSPASGVGSDTVGMFVSGSPNTLVIPTGLGGQYRISASVPWSPNSPGSSGATLYVTVTANGTPVATTANNSSGPSYAIIAPRVRTLADGAVIELHALVQGTSSAQLWETVQSQGVRAIILLEKIS